MSKPDEIIETDVLVVGGGGSGIMAAIEAEKYGVTVTMAVKGLVGHSGCTPAALGGIAGYYIRDPQDSWWQHFIDTVLGGSFLSDQRLAEVFTKQSPIVLLSLEEWGSIFDRTGEGGPYLRQFGGHSYARSVASGDRSGAEMIKGLKAKLFKSNVKILDEIYVTKLITSGQGQLAGATAIELKSGRFILFKTCSIILATGGMGRVFPIAFTADYNVGDGYYMAMLVGAKVIDMEMLQWHPTAVWWPPGLRGMAVSEAFRSEGGRLYNKFGERFMMKYSPEWLEVATRDFVSRSIYQEFMKGNATKRGGVYLSLSHVPAEIIEKRLPTMLSNMASVGIDIRKNPVEITPAVHYTDGGVIIDILWESVDVPGLYAIGEASGGVHGGNRLGSNSLPELMVSGVRSGQVAAMRALRMNKNKKRVEADMKKVAEEQERVFRFFDRKDGVNPLELRDRLMDLMWKNVGIIRNEERLRKAIEELDKIWDEELPNVNVSDGSKNWSYEWVEALDLYPRIFTGLVMAKSALIRTESRANHYREDYPFTDNQYWLKNVVVSYEERPGSRLSERLEVTTRPVVVTLLQPEDVNLPSRVDW